MVRRSIGPTDTYPGGPRALARDVGLSLPGGCGSYADVEDAAVVAYASRSGKARLVVCGPLSPSPAPSGSASTDRPSSERQRGIQR